MVSIIVPVLNVSKVIKPFLEMLLKQTNQDFELIFADGVSNDDTLSILNDYKHRFKKMHITSQQDNGIYDAMNKGVEFATGEWIYFMGVDDRFSSVETLKEIQLYLTESEDIIYGDVVWMPEDVLESGEWTMQIFIQRNINHQRIFYRRQLFSQHGGFNIKYKVSSDHDLNIRYFTNINIRKKYLPILIANFNSTGFSANKTDEAFWQDWDAIFLKNFKPFLDTKTIYGSLGHYIKFLIDKKQFGKVMTVSAKHFFNTGSLGFLKLTISYLFQSKMHNENRNSTLLAH